MEIDLDTLALSKGNKYRQELRLLNRRQIAINGGCNGPQAQRRLDSQALDLTGKILADLQRRHYEDVEAYENA